MAMNARIKKLWIKALRSGKYKQGKGELRPTPDTFCCLGVLCDLHSRTKEGKEWEVNGAYEYAHVRGTLPIEVSEWAGLDNGDPQIGRTLKASRLNDTGKTFEYIASRIEKTL